MYYKLDHFEICAISMVELFYVRKATARYSLANFHDFFFFFKHIGPNYTLRDARRILINLIGLISVLYIAASC